MREEQPLVSIIMAVKDTASYLPDCLTSILNQDYIHWELLAVNDHSSDNSLKILQSFSDLDARVKVFNGDGHRLIPTLQRAYKEVSGALINRMDSDDKMPHDKLSTLVQHWLQYGKGHVIAGGTKHFVDTGEVGGGFLRYEQWLNDVAKRNVHYEEIYRECVIPSHCWIIAKEDFDNVNAFDPIVYPEDYDLCFRFYKNNLKVIGIDKILHWWRDRESRISRTWEEYKDNRYFQMKVEYFYQIDRDYDRPLVLWGAGKNGKDLAKLIGPKEEEFHWVCDNVQKIGKDIYGTTLSHFNLITSLNNPQILIVVTSLEARIEIPKQLNEWDKKVVRDYWFFL